MQYGAPRTTTSWSMMAKLYTSPLKVPFLGLSGSLRSSGAVQKRSEEQGKG